MGIAESIIELTERLKLPLGVRSSSIQLYTNIKHLLKLEDVLMIHLCLFLGCKFEDIHGNLDRIMKHAGCIDMNRLTELEIDVLELINYEYNFVNVFDKAFGMLCIIENKIKSGEVLLHDYKKDWPEIKNRLNSLLCKDLTGVSMDNLAYAALDLDLSHAKIIFPTLNISTVP